MQVAKKKMKRLGVGIVGGLVLVIGIIAIPYPGPGWLIVFTGLAILATEFTWAQRVLDFAKSRYDSWTDWLKRQHIMVRVAVLVLTGLIVVVTLWLLNVFGMVNAWFHLPFNWAASPLFR